MSERTKGVKPSLDFNDPEPLIATVAKLFVADGQAKQVAVLANAVAVIRQTGYDSWGDDETFFFDLYLQVPHSLFAQISEDVEEIQTSILEKIEAVLKAYPSDRIGKIVVAPEVKSDPNWREKANAWLSGANVTNQGRVRSDNVAPKSCDGLLFRSEPEINLYKALKELGVTFAPLPVFLRGGKTYQRIEPDFIIIKSGIVMHIEVDGDTVHQETPAEAHARTALLLHEGVSIERVKASECSDMDAALATAKKLIQTISKIKESR